MTIANYKWIPGQGPSLEAIDRLRTEFLMPAIPMGEAWFISEVRRIYSELMQLPIAEIETEYLENVLREIASGTSCFGHLEEWDKWFRFLLPHLVLRSHESHTGDTLLEYLITASFNIFDQGLPNYYPNFRDDIIKTLSQCLMKSEFWFAWAEETSKQHILCPSFLVADGIPRRPRDWDYYTASAPASAAMFFCLRFLEQQEIVSWVESLVKIEDVFWKGHLLVWLVGFHELTQKLPLTERRLRRSTPTLKFNEFYLVDAWKTGKDFFPPENIRIFWREIDRQINAEKLLQWVDDFAAQPHLAAHLFHIPDTYFDKIICKSF